MNNQPLVRVTLISLAAALGGFLFGFDSGVINGTVSALQLAFNSTAVGTGFNVASMLLGCAIGAFFAGTLADKAGRRPVLLITALLFIVSAWGSGIAGSSAEFVLFRVLGGLAVGAASILVPAYIGEIAPASLRGRLISLQQLMIVLGLFFAFLSNYLIANAAGSAIAPFWANFNAWQWMFWVEIIPASLFFICLLLVPESPRYLVAAGKPQQAAAVLQTLTPADNAEAKVADIQSTLVAERKPALRDLLTRSGKLQPIVWVGIMLAVLQQFTGINVVFYYGATLWQAAGFNEADALAVNVIGGAVNISFTLLAIALVDKVGRKQLLLIGSLGQALMLTTLAAIFATSELTAAGNLRLDGNMGIYALLAANGYIAFFATTWGPVVWVMLGEMFPNQVRGAALAVCGILHWLSNFTITMSFPVLLASFGLGWAYGMYAAFSLLAFFLVKKLLQETRGRTLEQISRDAMQ
ncbi:sugar porter family MFS transporter [Arsukibacterium sp.]|uniref:sugar porter family MFS transporter n=1 Tax=Arsukibacterium sp. TaxID=1977258 RepID=UPI001BD61028|nr:sugar porter family MFS transporter [Arsukibacterium sp.]